MDKNKNKKKTVTNTTTEGEMHKTALLAMTGMGVGAILHQESQGQRELAESETLPTKGSQDSAWREIGVKFGATVEGDAMFRYVELPPGWKKVRTDHSMWTHLVDDKGRKRAEIFYKAAFYDRDAFISLTRRFEAAYEPEGGWEADRKRFNDSTTRGKDKYQAVVKDCGVEIWRSIEFYMRETQKEADARAAVQAQERDAKIADARKQIDRLNAREPHDDLAQTVVERLENEIDWLKNSFVDNYPVDGSTRARAASAAWLAERWPNFDSYEAYWD